MSIPVARQAATRVSREDLDIARVSGPANAPAIGEIPRALRVASQGRKPARELHPRANAELAIDAAEVGLDRLAAHEHGRGDLRVAGTRGSEFGDPRFGRGQRSRLRARAEPRELRR